MNPNILSDLREALPGVKFLHKNRSQCLLHPLNFRERTPGAACDVENDLLQCEKTLGDAKH